jgi:site-specific DNA-methyltransferase (adenine-specific)
VTDPYYADATMTVYAGDCLDVLPELADGSVDAVVTDPPYGLEFMGKEWDGANGFRRSLNPADADRDNAFGRTSRTSPEYRAARPFQAWCQLWAAECLRVLNPGAHLLAFGGTRTSHRLACAIEDAGFEIRDSIAWLYGSGFPKSLDVSKAIDRAAGAERDRVRQTGPMLSGKFYHPKASGNRKCLTCDKWTSHCLCGKDDGPATDDARTWQGWGTALKPAFEPVVVARKPLAGTVAANVVAHGTGALNIDGCRIEGESRPVMIRTGTVVAASSMSGESTGATASGETTKAGRWPANVVLDADQAAALDAQSGESVTGSGPLRRTTALGVMNDDGWQPQEQDGQRHPGAGGASRFFYTSREDRPCGSDDDTGTPGGSSPAQSQAGQSTNALAAAIETLAERFFYTAKAPGTERIRHDGIAHPTVKPLDLMRWLVRLVTPPNGLCLDPFAGSGTTAEACLLEGFRCITIEREPDYLPLIIQRINRRRDPIAYLTTAGDDLGLFGEPA